MERPESSASCNRSLVVRTPVVSICNTSKIRGSAAKILKPLGKEVFGFDIGIDLGSTLNAIDQGRRTIRKQTTWEHTENSSRQDLSTGKSQINPLATPTT